VIGEKRRAKRGGSGNVLDKFPFVDSHHGFVIFVLTTRYECSGFRA
jgi:hypothetical protein